MPTPRMTSSFKPVDTTTFARGNSGSLKAVVVGTVGNQSGVFYINVRGVTVRAKASIDAPIQVSDTVWVQNADEGWLITGVGV